MKLLSPALSGLIALFAIAADRAPADTFELSGGGEVVGEIVDRPEGGDFVVRTVDGVQVTLSRSTVARTVQESEAKIEYAQRSRAAADTVASHRELAAWCREHGLAAEADVHFARLLELDPNDEAARRSLGYARVGKRWLTREQLMAAHGMRLYEGKYRTEQDIAIRQREAQYGAVETDWFASLRLWCDWLRGGREARVQEALAKIAAVNDPSAAPAVIKLLKQEEDEGIFATLLDVLGRLNHPQGIETLVGLSLDDVTDATREKCLDYLTAADRPVSIVPYVQALKSKDNRVVNWAGTALGRLGDPAAVSPLIDAVVTRHKYQVQAGNPGQTNAAFDPSGTGGGGLSFGGGAPKVIERDEENPEVLRALIKLTGEQNFGYDAQAWRRWFVDQQMHERVNLRRDE